MSYPSTQHPHIPAGWECALDQATGHWYYYNRTTGVTSWVPPQSEAPGTASQATASPIATEPNASYAGAHRYSNHHSHDAPEASGSAVTSTQVAAEAAAQAAAGAGSEPCLSSVAEHNTHGSSSGSDGGWFYRDRGGALHGPFHQEHLRAWRSFLPMDLHVWYLELQKPKPRQRQQPAVGSRTAAGTTKQIQQQQTQQQQKASLEQDSVGMAKVQHAVDGAAAAEGSADGDLVPNEAAAEAHGTGSSATGQEAVTPTMLGLGLYEDGEPSQPEDPGQGPVGGELRTQTADEAAPCALALATAGTGDDAAAAQAEAEAAGSAGGGTAEPQPTSGMECSRAAAIDGSTAPAVPATSGHVAESEVVEPCAKRPRTEPPTPTPGCDTTEDPSTLEEPIRGGSPSRSPSPPAADDVDGPTGQSATGPSNAEEAIACGLPAIDLAELLGDGPLLTDWRRRFPGQRPPGTAPPAPVHDHWLRSAAVAAVAAYAHGAAPYHASYHPGSLLGVTDAGNGGGVSRPRSREESMLEYAEAVLAGLPPDDEAVVLARQAVAAGQSLADLVRFNWAAAAGGHGSSGGSAAAAAAAAAVAPPPLDEYGVPKEYVRDPRSGRLTAIGVGASKDGGDGGSAAKALYGEYGGWVNPEQIEDYLAKAKRWRQEQLPLLWARRKLKEQREAKAKKAARAGGGL